MATRLHMGACLLMHLKLWAVFFSKSVKTVTHVRVQPHNASMLLASTQMESLKMLLVYPLDVFLRTSWWRAEIQGWKLLIRVWRWKPTQSLQAAWPDKQLYVSPANTAIRAFHPILVTLSLLFCWIACLLFPCTIMKHCPGSSFLF